MLGSRWARRDVPTGSSPLPSHRGTGKDLRSGTSDRSLPSSGRPTRPACRSASAGKELLGGEKPCRRGICWRRAARDQVVVPGSYGAQDSTRRPDESLGLRAPAAATEEDVLGQRDSPPRDHLDHPSSVGSEHRARCRHWSVPDRLPEPLRRSCTGRRTECTPCGHRPGLGRSERVDCRCYAVCRREDTHRSVATAERR